MAIEYIYLVSGGCAIAIMATLLLLIQRKRRNDSLQMPQQESDALLEQREGNVGRWGDQIVGAPRVISLESIEDRVARIHERTQEYQTQHKRPPLYANATTLSSADKKPGSQTASSKFQRTLKRASNAASAQPRALYVMAPEGSHFRGNDIYQAVTNSGLHYGKMDIFHYHLNEDPHQPTLFSLASAVNPGTIDIDHIAHFSTPGLTLFLNNSSRAHQHIAQEAMITVAEQLADELGAIILDENRQPWSLSEMS